MKVTFVRHGETRENIKGILQGQLPGHLTRKGINQAKILAKRLAKEKFDIIYCSDLKRAKDTAREIIKYHKKVPIKYVKELREMHFSNFTGKPGGELWQKYLKSGVDYANFKPRGGESPLDLMKRIKKFLNKIYKKHKGQHLLLIAHGGVNETLWHICQNKIPKLTKRNRYKNRQYNCCVNILKFKKGKPKLLLYNCTKHLK